MFTKEVEIQEVELKDGTEEGGGLGALNYEILDNCETNIVKFGQYMEYLHNFSCLHWVWAESAPGVLDERPCGVP